MTDRLTYQWVTPVEPLFISHKLEELPMEGAGLEEWEEALGYIRESLTEIVVQRVHAIGVPTDMNDPQYDRIFYLTPTEVESRAYQHVAGQASTAEAMSRAHLQRQERKALEVIAQLAPKRGERPV